VNCRPENTPSDKINVEDTEDEFIIKKPEIKDEAYEKFVDELYHHDESKKPKTKRSSDDGEKAGEKLTVEQPKEFEIPVKPVVHEDENYDKFITHLYRHDELKRSRRMIVFRHV
jgi:DNA polymerase sigma